MVDTNITDEGCPPKCRDEVEDVGGPQISWYVYVLQSISKPIETYVGYSRNPRARLAKHNRGENKSTARYRPWKFITLIGFPTEEKAKEFESYLKSGSGRAFRKKHFQ